MKLTKYKIGLLAADKKIHAAVLAVKHNVWTLQDYFELTAGVMHKIRWPKRYQAIAGLCDEQVIVKTFSLDKRCSKADIYQYICHQSEKLFRMPIKQLHFDFALLGQQDNQMRDVIACACKKNDAAALVQQCQPFGLTLHALDYQPFAWLRALRLCQLNLTPSYAILCKQPTHYLCVAKTQNQLWVQKEDLNHADRLQNALLELGVKQYWHLNEEFSQSGLPINIKKSTHLSENLTIALFTCLGLATWSKHIWP